MAKKATPKTKSEIMAALAEAGEISKKQAGALYDALLSIAYAGAKDPKGIMLPGLGKLIKVKRPARKGRNPRTKEEITIPATVAPAFKAGKALKDAVAK